MKKDMLLFIALAILAGFSLSACGGGGRSGGNANGGNSRGPNRNAAGGNEGPDHAAGAGGVDQVDDPDEALILSTENNVSLKPKGAAAFVAIFKNVPFHSGDTLRVGDQSKAVIFCKDTCELDTGVYPRCCIPACKTAVDIQPPPGDQHKFFMMKKDLSPSEARLFDERESKINGLGLGTTASQFLKANLYTAWKLNEAAGELQMLDQQLDKPEAKQELSELYPAVSLKTGDLLLKTNQRDRAIQRYQKTIDATPDAAGAVDRSQTEKATAHNRLAEIYVSGGQKAAAVESLNHAKEIYVRQGEPKKAQEIDSKILRIKSQP